MRWFKGLLLLCLATFISGCSQSDIHAEPDHQNQNVADAKEDEEKPKEEVIVVPVEEEVIDFGIPYEGLFPIYGSGLIAGGGGFRRDRCPDDDDKKLPGTCGCGVPDDDTDEDGTKDCKDNCPNDPLKLEPGQCGCNVSETDSDEDGTLDCDDDCPTDPEKIAAGQCGCGNPDTDDDDDGLAICRDNCPTVASTDVTDSDADELGAPCDCDDNNRGLGAITTGTPRYVSPSGDDDGNANTCEDPDDPCETIENAINAATAGDTIVLSDGTFEEEALVVNKNLRIFGRGPEVTGGSIVSGAGAGDNRIFNVNEDIVATFCGLRVTLGRLVGANEVGGGIAAFSGATTTLSNVAVIDNETTLSGGGINSFAEGTDTTTLIIINSQVSDNSAQNGGGISNASTTSGSTANAVISNSLISENTAIQIGGGINSGTAVFGTANLTVNNSRVIDNSVTGNGVVSSGGGVSNATGPNADASAVATATISDTTISGNSAIVAGGGINNQTINNGTATLTINRSTLSENSVTGAGGGLSNNVRNGTATSTLNDVTISGNDATAFGGGIDTGSATPGSGNANLNVNNSTVTDNESAVGGGVSNQELGTGTSTATYTHSIVAEQESGADCANVGTPVNTTNGHNIESGTSCAFNAGTDQQSVSEADLALGDLADNGGPTLTHALGPDSVAIDEGVILGNTGCTRLIDQRGEERGVDIPSVGEDGDNYCDVGAFERQLVEPPAAK